MRLKDRFKKDGDFCFRYRSYLPFVLIPILVLVLFSFDSPLYSAPMGRILEAKFNNILIIFALLVGIFGQIIRIFVAGFVPRDTSGRNTREQKASVLNTSGFYSICRNPLYLGNFFMMLAPVILVGNWLFVAVFVLLFWLYYERIIMAEEEFLSAKFGESYESWALQTPCFFPNFKHYKKANEVFSLKSMLKREYHSLFGLAVSLFLVHYVVVLFEAKAFELPNYILSAFLLICGVIYLACLFLAKKTSVLNVENR